MPRQGLPGPAETSRPISAKARQIWTHVAPEAVKMQCFLYSLHFSPAGVFFPFQFPHTKRVQIPKKIYIRHAILDEIRRKRGKKKGYYERSVFLLSFFTLFRPLSQFHAICVLLSLLKDGILKWSKRTGVKFSGFYSSLGCVIC
jgi:hypothetical protein